MLGLIGQFYDIEDDDPSGEPGRAEGCAAGAERAGPGSPGEVLARAEGQALPKSQYGKAIAYVLNLAGAAAVHRGRHAGDR